MYEGSAAHSSILDEPFPSFEEYTAFRDIYSPLLTEAYQDLMRKPTDEVIKLTNEIKPWFDELLYSHTCGWHQLSAEGRWIMSLYAEELKRRFGALSIVDKNLLPAGVMKMLRQKKVTWQLILWD